MSVESESARADLMAAGIIAEHFGRVKAASAEAFTLDYGELRDLIALAYLHGQKDGLVWATSTTHAPR